MAISTLVLLVGVLMLHRFQGVSVLGGAKDICKLKETHKFNLVLIAMPSSTGGQMRSYRPGLIIGRV